VQIESKAPNDCAIVACSHYFGIHYDAVVTEFQTIADELGIQWKRQKGTPSCITDMFCARRGLNQYPVPRRGQEKITGVISLHSANARSGHMVCMIDGIVFDAFAPEGIPIREYQSLSRCNHIRKVLR
jgi:hypothetical protein